MTVDHESDEGEPYDDGDIEGLPEYQDLGGGVSEWNVSYDSDVLEIIHDAAQSGDRLEFTVYDADQGAAFHLFDGGISASYLEEQMYAHEWDVADMVGHFSGGKIETEGIEFFTIHEY